MATTLLPATGSQQLYLHSKNVEFSGISESMSVKCRSKWSVLTCCCQVY